MSALWEEPDPPQNPGSGEGFAPTLPASVQTVRFVFISATGFACCVSVDPDAAPTNPDSGKRFIILDSLPVGPGTIQLSGFPTTFATTPSGVTEMCAVDPLIGRACSTRPATPSFDSGPQPVNIRAQGDTDAGDISIDALPFLLMDALQPDPSSRVNSPVPIGFTVVDAVTGIDAESVDAALIPIGGSRRNLELTLQACRDGTATPCSPGSQFDVRGFIVTVAPQALPTGGAALELAAQNLATAPRTMELVYDFTVLPPPPTATATSMTAPPATPSPTPPTPLAPSRTPTSTFRSATPTRQPTSTPGGGSLTFARAPAFAVSRQPSFLAVGDFNRDGRDDVAVASPESKDVNILLANADGTLALGTSAAFGSFPGWIAAGHLNTDSFLDLAVADERDQGLYFLFGAANGAFGIPTLHETGQRPFGIVIGDFDRQTGNDLAVTDRDANRVTMLLNNGMPNPAFRFGGNAGVGPEPEDIVNADFNGDGALDVVTLDTGGTEVKELSVLTFSRVDAGLVVFNRTGNFTVGENPLGVAVAELNRDGRPDLVSFNRPNQGFGEIHYVLSGADGQLHLADPVIVHCPDGELNCRARAMAVGDFDDDGVSDVAVALNQAGQGLESGVIRVFLGTGDGAFRPGPIATAQSQPLAMITGDFTGDDRTDIIVTSAETNAVQVFINASPED
jgi:hypothetical protein